MANKTVPRQTSWKAEHFIHFKKGTGWYTVFTIVMVLIMVGALYFRQWLLAGVIAAGMFAIYSFSKQKPPDRQYRIDSSGIQIGRKKLDYQEIKSFWLVATPETNLLYLQLAKRFLPPEMINLGQNDPLRVRKILSQHLPEERKSETLIDTFNRWIRF